MRRESSDDERLVWIVRVIHFHQDYVGCRIGGRLSTLLILPGMAMSYVFKLIEDFAELLLLRTRIIMTIGVQQLWSPHLRNDWFVGQIEV